MSQTNRRKPIDYFAMESATGNALKVTESNENRSVQSTSGANSYGDAAVVDSYGETAAPSASYDVVAEVAHTPESPKVTLGALVESSEALGVPVVVGGLTISTSTGSAPTVSVTGQGVQAGARQLRAYKVPAFTLSPRHRAQDFLGLCTIKKGSEAASDVEDYGLTSVGASFPIEFTLGQPQGTLLTYDLHGGTATCDFQMNWYDDTAPTIGLTEVAKALGAVLSAPVAKSVPRDGYVQYSWQVSFPMKGEEVAAA